MPRWERWWTKSNINQALRCACSIKDKNIDAYSRNRKVHSQSWKHGWKVIRLWNDVILMKDTSSGSWLELAWFGANWATSYIAQHQSRCQALRKAWFVPQQLWLWHLTGTGQWAVELRRHTNAADCVALRKTFWNSKWIWKYDFSWGKYLYWVSIYTKCLVVKGCLH